MNKLINTNSWLNGMAWGAAIITLGPWINVPFVPFL